MYLFHHLLRLQVNMRSLTRGLRRKSLSSRLISPRRFYNLQGKQTVLPANDSEAALELDQASSPQSTFTMQLFSRNFPYLKKSNRWKEEIEAARDTSAKAVLDLFSRLRLAASLTDPDISPILCQALAKHGFSTEIATILRLMEAEGKVPQRDVFLSLIEAYCQKRRLSDALNALDRLVQSHASPPTHAFELIINLAGLMDKDKMVISVFDLMRRFKLEPSGKACAYVGVSYAKMDDKHKFHGWMVRYISKSTPSSSLSSVLRHTCRKFAHFGLTAYARKLRTWCQQEGLGEPEHLAILQAMGNGARNELGAKMKEAIAKRAWYDVELLIHSILRGPRSKQLLHWMEFCSLLVSLADNHPGPSAVSYLFQLIKICQRRRIIMPPKLPNLLLRACLVNKSIRSFESVFRYVQQWGGIHEPILASQCAAFIYSNAESFPDDLMSISSDSPLFPSVLLHKLQYFVDTHNLSGITELLDKWLNVSPDSDAAGEGETPSPTSLLFPEIGLSTEAVVDAFLAALGNLGAVNLIDRMWTDLIHKHDFVPSAQNYVNLVSVLTDVGYFAAAYNAATQALLLMQLGHEQFLTGAFTAVIRELFSRANVSMPEQPDWEQFKQDELSLNNCLLLRQLLVSGRDALFAASKLQPEYIEITDAHRIIFTLQNMYDAPAN